MPSLAPPRAALAGSTGRAASGPRLSDIRGVIFTFDLAIPTLLFFAGVVALLLSAGRSVGAVVKALAGASRGWRELRKLRPPRAVSPDFETLCIRCGAELDSRRLLVRTLALHGFDVHEHELKWFAQAFWAQSIALKGHHGWLLPRAADLPGRVHELLAKILDRPADEVVELMDRLIDVWLRQAGEAMRRFGHEVPW